ncbi:Golgi apyrase [Cyphellophora attinorum]|uniref:Golgi apyrase n=1 Tax=Cyphellophora attinorum TaxID=1664694 RepID=A0A0N1NWW9_9EURO|nr:Golgi apyrase [Phialophora attinorum]KPI36012.1 Golgi apyrase [Phialophora attinorum]
MVNTEKWNYGIVLDAGSSGTRIYIYRWLRNEVARLEADTHTQLPEIKTKSKWTKKVHTGLSTYGPTPQLIGDDHLQPLVEHALKYVPKELVPETPVFLLATAGMRLLPDQQQTNVLNAVCTYFKEKTDFYLPDCDLHVQIIPGETEGLYGWIAANYLVGGFKSPITQDHNHGKGHHTYGFLDMGGASSQIAFVPNTTEAARHAEDLKLLRLRTIDGVNTEYKVFTTTWLGYGVNEARKSYLDTLLSTYGPSVNEYPDPCLPHGVRMSMDSSSILDISTTNKHLLGTGDIDQCLKDTRPLLKLDAVCPDKPCLFNGQHVPAIDFDVNHFIGISNYWHNTHEIFEMGYDDKVYDFATYQARVRNFCSQDWADIQRNIKLEKWGHKVDEATAEEVCFKAVWMINMLHEGIGVPRVGIDTNATTKPQDFNSPFQAVDEIKNTEVTWTLGKILLYATSTIPMLDAASVVDGIDPSPVGFGSNDGSLIPADFTFPSSKGALNAPSSPSYTGGIVDKVHSTLFKSDSAHRLPGLIFLLLILLIISFFLCGRDRRNRFYHSVGLGSLASQPGSSGATVYRKAPVTSSGAGLPRRTGVLVRVLDYLSPFGSSYARVPHDTEANHPLVAPGLHDPSEFELHDFDDDEDLDSDGDGLGKKVSSRPKPSPIDRAGLVVRTESRERLSDAFAGGGGRNAGGVSRTGSPKRHL